MLIRYALRDPQAAAGVYVHVRGRTLYLTSPHLTDADVDVLRHSVYKVHFKRLRAARKPLDATPS